MTTDNQQFFRDIIAAGAIIAGFCGTFLAFRIQREASYYRQPNLNATSQEIDKDIYIGMTQFSSSFFLIILAACLSVASGLIVPLLGLSGKSGALITPRFAVSGLVSTLILLAGYFFDEMIHYEIVWKNWRSETSEWNREWPIVTSVLALAIGAFAYTYCSLVGQSNT